MWFGELVAIFNGCWFEKGVMVHYCSGADCCPRGILDTRARGGQALKRTVFKDRPVVPQLSRWSKGVASLDFWLLGMFVHEIVLLTFTEGLVKSSERNEVDMRTLLQDLDPGSLHDSAAGFKALNGSRLTRTMGTLSAASTPPLLWVLSLLLGVLRYVSKFLQASVRSVRVKARHSGHPSRPGVFDMTNVLYSPVVVAMQALSALLASGPQFPSVAYEILQKACGANDVDGRFRPIPNKCK